MSDCYLRALDDVVHSFAPFEVKEKLGALRTAIVMDWDNGDEADRDECAQFVQDGMQIIERLSACKTLAALDEILPEIVTLVSAPIGNVESKRVTCNAVVSMYGACRVALVAAQK